jgi:anti-anti-sigma factor
MQLHTNEISFEHHGTITLLDIKGDITSFSEPFLSKAYKKAVDQGASHILLKFDPDAYINSGGIAVLIEILSQTRENDQIIGIAGVSRHYKKILTMVGITKFASIHETVENAIQKMA